jgi:hypothetical protein
MELRAGELPSRRSIIACLTSYSYEPLQIGRYQLPPLQQSNEITPGFQAKAEEQAASVRELEGWLAGGRGRCTDLCG